MCGGPGSGGSKSAGRGYNGSFSNMRDKKGNFNPAGRARADNRAAMSGGSNISNGPGGSFGNNAKNPAAMTKQALGAPAEPASTKTTGVLMNRAPVSPARMTSIYGTTGIDPVEETEKAFTGSRMNPFDGATIKTSKDIGWDFSPDTAPKDRLQGSVVAKPNRGLGAIRDGLFGLFGKTYDRDITPNRAKDMLSKGKGTLNTWTEGLGKGNYQYDEEGNPDTDGFGMAYEAASPIVNALMGNVSGTISGTRSALGTAMDHHKLQQAGVFGAPTKQQAKGSTAPRHAPATKPGVKHSTMAMMGGSDENRDRTLMVRREVSPVTPLQNKNETATKRARPPRGKSSLILTGSQGLLDRPNVLMQRLLGGSRKRKPILMQRNYK